MHPTRGEPTAAPLVGGKSKLRSPSQLQGRGDELLADWAARVEAAGGTELESLALALASEPGGRDITLWIPLLARWSEMDGAAMINFVATKTPASLRENLLPHAWFAWGVSDPEKAFAAGRNLKSELVCKLLEGVAETDPQKAADFVYKVPEAHYAVRSIAKLVAEKAPDLGRSLLSRAMYDSARKPLQEELTRQLAANDPAQAVAYARSCGIIAEDPVPKAIALIAATDPAKAIEQIEAMPSSRAKALSSVALARVWAAQDPEAVTAWARETLDGPALHYSLVTVASAIGRQDPAKAFDLLLEAGSEAGGDFFHVIDDNIQATEARSIPDVRKITETLLEQMKDTDPEKARRFVREKLRGETWRNWAKEAGVEP